MYKKELFQLPTILDKLPSTVEECHHLIRYLLQTTIPELFRRVEKLEIENNILKERLNNNSSNSSLPPSKDVKKKKKPASSSLNKGGGQKGHKGHFRTLLDSDQVNAVVPCFLPSRCRCGGNLAVKKETHRHQVHELPDIKLSVTEYVLEKGSCVQCGRHCMAELPEGVTWGITGPKLTAFMSIAVSKYQLSRRQLKDFLKEQYHFDLALGTVFNKQKIVNAALQAPVSDLLDVIKQSPSVHMDETGHNRDGKREWMWGFVSETAAFFSIVASRGKKALTSFMGDFKHIAVSDRYAAYNYFESSQRQICWAHLKRDFTRLSEKKDKVIARIGKHLLRNQSKLFKYWYDFKQGHLTREGLLKETEPIRKQIGEFLEQGSYTDPQLRTAGFCKNRNSSAPAPGIE